MAMHLIQPSGLGARLGSRSSARSAVPIGSFACVQPRALGSSRRRQVIPKAAAPEVETAEEVVEYSEVSFCIFQANPAEAPVKSMVVTVAHDETLSIVILLI